MTQFSITFGCGHEGQAALYGNQDDMEQRLGRLRDRGKCPKCIAEEMTVELDLSNLPDLEGTPKQISWAIALRAKRLEDIQILNETHKVAIAEKKEKGEAVMVVRNQEVLNLWDKGVAILASETSAVFYIDTRSLPSPEAIIEVFPEYKSGIREIMARYRKKG